MSAHRFVLVLPTLSRVRFYDTELEGYQVTFWQSFNRSLNRWMLDVENKTLGKKVYGIVMNQGVDLLNASGHLDLQALVLTNVTGFNGLEADAENLGTELVLVYMDLQTYHDSLLDGAIVGRGVYRVPTST